MGSLTNANLNLLFQSRGNCPYSGPTTASNNPLRMLVPLSLLESVVSDAEYEKARGEILKAL